MIQNPPGNKENQCLNFCYWHFFSATYCKFLTDLSEKTEVGNFFGDIVNVVFKVEIYSFISLLPS